MYNSLSENLTAANLGFSNIMHGCHACRHWVRKNHIAEEELDCIDVDDIGNLGDSPRLVLIDESNLGTSL